MSFKSPNYTQLPNDLFDEYLPQLGYSELKVLLYLCRQTFGYQTQKAKSSIRDIAKHTGLSQRRVWDGVQRAVELGLMTKHTDGISTTEWEISVNGGVVLKTTQGVVLKTTPHDVKTTHTSNKEIYVSETSKSGRVLNPPAAVFRKEVGVYPNSTQEQAMAAVTDLEAWRAVIKEWRLRGYAPTNVRGMLDWLANGIPAAYVPKQATQPQQPARKLRSAKE